MKQPRRRTSCRRHKRFLRRFTRTGVPRDVLRLPNEVTLGEIW